MRKYWAFYRVNLNNTLIYRGTLLMWLFGNFLNLLIMTSVWLSVNSKGEIGGYGKSQLITYYIFAGLLWWLVGWHCFSWVREAIRDGTISTNTLIKPVSYYWETFFKEFGWHTIGAPIGLIASLTALFVLKNFFLITPEFNNVFLAIISLVVATIIVFSMNLCLGLLTFWFTETQSLNHVIWAGSFILGGQGIPITFIPGAFRNIVELLPFRYMLSFPLELLFGRLSTIDIALGFLGGISWIVILSLIYKILWQRGTKVYTSFGG